jgi:hypothetical protein
MTKGGEIIKLTREKTIEKDFLFYLQNASIVSIKITSAFGVQIIFEFNEDVDLGEYSIHTPYLQINGDTIYNEGKRMVETKRVFVKLVLIKNADIINDVSKFIYISDTIKLNYTSYNQFMGEIISQIDITNKTNNFLASVTPQILYYKLINPSASEDSQLTTLFIDAINNYMKINGSKNDTSMAMLYDGLLKLFKTDQNKTFIGIIGMEMLPGDFDDLEYKNDFQCASGMYELIRAGTVGYIHMDAHMGNIKWLSNYKHYYRSDNPNENITGRAILIDWGMVAKMNLRKDAETLLELFNKEINEQNVMKCVDFYKQLYVKYLYSINYAQSPLFDNINLAINPKTLQELVRVFKLRKNEELSLLNKNNELNNIYEWWNREKYDLITISNIDLDYNLVEWPAEITFDNTSAKSHFSFVSSSDDSSSSSSSDYLKVTKTNLNRLDKSMDASSPAYLKATKTNLNRLPSSLDESMDAYSSPYYMNIKKSKPNVSLGGKTVKNKKRKLRKTRKNKKN